MTLTFESRISDKYGKVAFDRNYYSSSPKFAKETVYVKVTSDTVIIMNTKYQAIVEHSRLYGKSKESMNWLPYIDLMSKRPTAIKYTGLYETLPDNWKKYLSDLPAEEKREALLALHTMLLKHDINVASDVLSITLSNGVKDADSILASYRRLTSPVHQLNPIQLKSTVIKMPVFKTDNIKYDNLISKEVILK